MLQFTPNIKRKRGAELFCDVTPFPELIGRSTPYKGIFTGISVEICDKKDMMTLFQCGNYGKSTKTRSAPLCLIQTKNADLKNKDYKTEETLSLYLEEAFFLAYFLKVLLIQNLLGVTMDWEEMLKAGIQTKSNFIELFVSYLYLKSKNWIVKSGIKFGGNFLIYKKSLRLYHASFIVLVSSSLMAGKDIKGLQRIAEASDKDVLFLEVTKPNPGFKPNSLSDFSLCSVTETIVRRFNYTSFVQKQN